MSVGSCSYRYSRDRAGPRPSGPRLPRAARREPVADQRPGDGRHAADADRAQLPARRRGLDRRRGGFGRRVARPDADHGDQPGAHAGSVLRRGRRESRHGQRAASERLVRRLPRRRRRQSFSRRRRQARPQRGDRGLRRRQLLPRVRSSRGRRWPCFFSAASTAPRSFRRRPSACSRTFRRRIPSRRGSRSSTTSASRAVAAETTTARPRPSPARRWPSFF